MRSSLVLSLLFFHIPAQAHASRLDKKEADVLAKPGIKYFSGTMPMAFDDFASAPMGAEDDAAVTVRFATGDPLIPWLTVTHHAATLEVRAAARRPSPTMTQLFEEQLARITQFVVRRSDRVLKVGVDLRTQSASYFAAITFSDAANEPTTGIFSGTLLRQAITQLYLLFDGSDHRATAKLSITCLVKQCQWVFRPAVAGE